MLTTKDQLLLIVSSKQKIVSKNPFSCLYKSLRKRIQAKRFLRQRSLLPLLKQITYNEQTISSVECLGRGVKRLTYSAAHPRPEPFDRLKALSSIEGLGSNASPAFESGVRKRRSGSTLSVRLSSRRSQSQAFRPVSRRVDFFAQIQ